jgi:hypothetical protein
MHCEQATQDRNRIPTRMGNGSVVEQCPFKKPALKRAYGGSITYKRIPNITNGVKGALDFLIPKSESASRLS